MLSTDHEMDIAFMNSQQLLLLYKMKCEQRAHEIPTLTLKMATDRVPMF